MEWSWQQRSVDAVREAWRKGYRAVCLTLPTGMGKGKIGFDLVEPITSSGVGRVVILSHQRTLTGQIGKRLDERKVDFGFIASNFRYDQFPNVQVVSAQTANRRDLLPEASIVIVDEAHNHTFDSLVSKYKEETNASICGLTATPIGVQNYDILISGGTKAEGRAARALVACHVYAPSEADIKGVRRETKEVKAGERLFSLVQHHVFADVLQSWKAIQIRHGKDFKGGHIPSVLWAPGVPESRWFAAAFCAEGIPAAHIDGTTSTAERDRIREESKNGQTRVVCSMGVLREGVDWPWLSHGIAVQTWGSIATYLQCVGRILRADAGKPYAVLQDHAGSWHRHGSPNRDIEWELGDTEESVERKLKAPAPKSKDDCPEGVVCPQCRSVRQSGPRCPKCGYEHTKSVRRVFTEDGNLVEVEGSPNYTKPRDPVEDEKVWKSCLFACGRSGRTMGQAVGMFKSKVGHDPYGMPDVPSSGSIDWDRRVADVCPWTQPRKEVIA